MGVLEQLTTSRYQPSHPGKKTTKRLKIAEETKEKGDGKRTLGDWDDECVRWKSKRRRGVESVGAQIG